MSDLTKILTVALHCAADQLDGANVGDIVKHAARFDLPDEHRSESVALGAAIARFATALKHKAGTKRVVRIGRFARSLQEDGGGNG